MRRGLPRGRDPHGEGSARACRRADRDQMWLDDGRAADLEAAERRRQALPAGRRDGKRGPA